MTHDRFICVLCLCAAAAACQGDEDDSAPPLRSLGAEPREVAAPFLAARQPGAKILVFEAVAAAPIEGGYRVRAGEQTLVLPDGVEVTARVVAVDGRLPDTITLRMQGRETCGYLEEDPDMNACGEFMHQPPEIQPGDLFVGVVRRQGAPNEGTFSLMASRPILPAHDPDAAIADTRRFVRDHAD